MSEENNNQNQNSNIPLLKVLNKRGKRASSMLSFRPTKSMSTSKSLRKPKTAVAVIQIETESISKENNKK